MEKYKNYSKPYKYFIKDNLRREIYRKFGIPKHYMTSTRTQQPEHLFIRKTIDKLMELYERYKIIKRKKVLNAELKAEKNKLAIEMMLLSEILTT